MSAQVRIGKAPWLVCTVALLLAQTPAHAEDPACMSRRDEAEAARQALHLVNAVTLFRQCAASDCASAVQKECRERLADVEARLPSVVLSARDDEGRDVLDVSVELDGSPMENPLSGLAVPLDPGAHHFEFVRADGSSVSVDYVVQESSKGQPVTAVFESKERATPAAPKPQQHVESAAPPSDDHTLVYVLLGAGTLAFAGFGYFALDGRAQQSALERSCAPNCSMAAREQVETSYLLADLSLLASAAAFGGAAYLYFGPAPMPSAESGKVGFGVSARGRF